MSEMIERVARAIYSGAYPKHKFENDSQRIRDHYREVARAAMEAMRVPTAEMLPAGLLADEGCEMPGQIYRAMIDAALSH